MRRRFSVVLVIGAVGFAALSGAQELVFSDGFESASICAWSNDRWYPDVDGDLFGDSTVPGILSDCPSPSTMVSNALDCDDGSELIFPGATEICNGIDDDCSDVVDDGDDLCSSGRACCEGTCTYVESDPTNCGFCGNSCDLDHTLTHDCINGHCAIDTCEDGWDSCNGFHDDGCETQISSDPENCGVCGLICDLPQTASHSCVNAECGALTCDAGYGDCNSNPADGCELSVTEDIENCGECGHLCNLPNTGSHACEAGSCTVMNCNPTWGNCDGNDSNGCELRIGGSDVRNCGACGFTCPGYGRSGTTVSCDAGECQMDCRSHYYDCNDQASDGCERFDPYTSSNHHSEDDALDLGGMPCNDGESNPDIADLLLSDRHTHPNVIGFDDTVGSAPDWFEIDAVGGFFCVNDISLTLQLSNPSCSSCYRLTVFTNEGLYSCTTTGSSCTISQGVGSYSDDTKIFIKVEKTCSSESCVEEVAYTVTGHL